MYTFEQCGKYGHMTFVCIYSFIIMANDVKVGF